MNPLVEIENELKELEAVELLRVSRLSPQKVPNNYFKDFPGIMMDRIHWEEDTAADYDSPILAKISKKPPFAVPDGYFSALTEKVTGNISAQKPAKVVSINQRKKAGYKNLLIAASVVALLGFSLFFWTQEKPQVENATLADLHQVSDATLVGYLSDVALPETTGDDMEDILFLSQSYTLENIEGILNEVPEEDLIYYSKDYL